MNSPTTFGYITKWTNHNNFFFAVKKNFYGKNFYRVFMEDITTENFSYRTDLL